MLLTRALTFIFTLTEVRNVQRNKTELLRPQFGTPHKFQKLARRPCFRSHINNIQISISKIPLISESTRISNLIWLIPSDSRRWIWIDIANWQTDLAVVYKRQSRKCHHCWTAPINLNVRATTFVEWLPVVSQPKGIIGQAIHTPYL